MRVQVGGGTMWCAAALVAMSWSPEPRAGQEVDPMEPLGSVRPRAAKEIQGNPWSVGAETMDRDYTVYKHWKDYLGPLGVKRARIQAGWAKTEKTKGVYDWDWLDEIIPDMAAQGVQPWVCLSYANPLYGDEARLHGRFPTGKEAMAAWERFVAAFAHRYGKYVDEWEVWNEPDPTSDLYADFFVRTARVIRREQPHDKVLGLALGGWNVGRGGREILTFLKKLDERKAMELIDVVTYHGYKMNPDEVTLDEVRAGMAKISPNVTLMQGEAGVPHQRSIMWLGKHDWTETIQAKWALRRLLTDLHLGIPSSYFSIVDMRYPKGFNRKGLLLAKDDRTVMRPKQAYHSIQHLTAIFDHTLKRVADDRFETDADRPVTLHAYRKKDGRQVLAAWFGDRVPTDENAKTPVSLTLPAGRFSTPVFVDLRTGEVLAFADQQWQKTDDGVTFHNVPLYDSPVLIAERSTVPLRAEDKPGSGGKNARRK